MKPVSVSYVTPGRYTDEDEDDVSSGALVPYSAQERQGLVRRGGGPTFVPAGPKPTAPARIEVLPPEQPLTPAASLASQVSGSYQDRAKGFQIATVPIAAAFGGGSALVALLGFGVPLLSLPMLAVFWIAFLAWWLAGWLIHHLFSADGVALLHTLKGWQYLEREQRARLSRYEQE